MQNVNIFLASRISDVTTCPFLRLLDEHRHAIVQLFQALAVDVLLVLGEEEEHGAGGWRYSFMNDCGGSAKPVRNEKPPIKCALDHIRFYIGNGTL